MNVKDAAASLARSHCRPWAPPIEFTASLLATRRLHPHFSSAYGDIFGLILRPLPRIVSDHHGPFAGFTASATATALCRPAAANFFAVCFAISDSILSAPSAAPAQAIETQLSIASPSLSLAHQPTAAVLLPARVASTLPLLLVASCEALPLSIYRLRRQPNHGFVQRDPAE